MEPRIRGPVRSAAPGARLRSWAIYEGRPAGWPGGRPRGPLRRAPCISSNGYADIPNGYLYVMANSLAPVLAAPAVANAEAGRPWTEPPRIILLQTCSSIPDDAFGPVRSKGV